MTFLVIVIVIVIVNEIILFSLTNIFVIVIVNENHTAVLNLPTQSSLLQRNGNDVAQSRG